jgi:hypothetical protein
MNYWTGNQMVHTKWQLTIPLTEVDLSGNQIFPVFGCPVFQAILFISMLSKPIDISFKILVVSKLGLPMEV